MMQCSELIKQTIESAWRAEALDALSDFIRVPSLAPGFDPDWEKNGYLHQVCESARAYGQARFAQAQFRVLSDCGVSPCLYFDIPATGSKQSGSVLFYGHLDKQPEASGWTNGRSAFSPKLEGSRLYGRGASDDGYSFYLAMTAIEAMQKAGVDHPRILGLIETAEECGSTDLPHWLEVLKNELSDVRLLIALDSSIADYERLWVCTSFRGMAQANLRVSVLNKAVHSGRAAGLVPDSFMVMRELLNRIEDSRNGEILEPKFHAAIPPARLTQLKDLAQILGEKRDATLPWVDGVRPMQASVFENMLEQTWKPKLTITGTDGIPPIRQAGNVVRPYTALKLAFRLPAHANSEEALAAAIKTLTTDVPFGARVDVWGTTAKDGWDAKPEQAWFSQSLEHVSQELFGKPAGFISSGGTIGILNLFERYFPQAQFMVTGVLGPDSNAHSGDEMLDLDYTKKLTMAVTSVIRAMPS